MRKTFKKTLIFILSALLMIGSLAIFSACSPDLSGNRITNGDFILRDEDGVATKESGYTNVYKYWADDNDPTVPYGWLFYTKGTKTTHKLDRDITQNGGVNFFEINHGSERTYSYLAQTIDVKKDTYYTISLKYRTESTISTGNLMFFIEQDPTIPVSRVYDNTSLNFDKWTTYSISINTSSYSQLKLYLAFGGRSEDLFGISSDLKENSTGSDLNLYGAEGRVQIRDIVVSEPKTTPTNAFKLDIVRKNMFKNYDLAVRDENGRKVTENGKYIINKNEDGTPVDWVFETENSALSSVETKREEKGVSETVNGQTVTHTSENNYIKIAHSDYTYSRVYQKVDVKPGRYYQINYYYYIPQRGLSFSTTEPFGAFLYIGQDPLYILNVKQTGTAGTAYNNQNHFTPTAMTGSSRWKFSTSFYIYSGNNSSLDLGLSFGQEGSEVVGEVWVTSFSMVEVDSGINAYIHKIETNSGYSNNTVLYTVLLCIFICLFIAAFLLLIWWTTRAFSPKISAAADDVEADQAQTDDTQAEGVQLEVEQEATTEQPILAENEQPPKVPDNDNIDSEATKGISFFEKIIKKLPSIIKSPEFIFGCLVAFGFALRTIFAFVTRGYRDNIDQILNVANTANNSGLREYILAGGPQFMPLAVLITAFFGSIQASISSFSAVATQAFLFKLPTIIADCGIAVLLYFIAKKQSKMTGIIAGIIYLFNPLTLLNAATLRIDTLFIFFLALTLLFVLRKNIIASCLAYTVAVLLNIYSLAVAPALAAYLGVELVLTIISIIKGRRDRKYSKADLKNDIFTIAVIPSTIIVCFFLFYLVSLPLTYSRFTANIFEVLKYYFIDGLKEYTLLSSNGLNIFSMITLNARPLSENFPYILFTVLFFVVLTTICVIVYIKFKKRPSIVILAAYCIYAISIFFTGINEIFAFALLPLLIISFVRIKDKRLLFITFAFSLLHFVNLYLILMNANYLNNLPAYLLNPAINSQYNGSIIFPTELQFVLTMLSTLNIAVFVFMTYTIINIFFFGKRSLYAQNDGRITFGKSLYQFIK